MADNVYNPSYLEAEKGGLKFQATPGKTLESSYAKIKPSMVVSSFYTSYLGGRDRRVIVQGQPR
jgi:hypothetical protein